MHQHRGVATSFVLDGALVDFAGPISLHQAGINLHGATHDAIAYQHTLLVSRLEGPVVYPASRGTLTGLHAGSRHAEFGNPAPEASPDINVAVEIRHFHAGRETGTVVRPRSIALRNDSLVS
ncbi:MAG TPA: hypothetical protein PKV72_03840 [Candidatus Peribacteria bacterium]|nr:hypothetical protein [Candidatus Peribacteria bacterium]